MSDYYYKNIFESLYKSLYNCTEYTIQKIREDSGDLSRSIVENVLIKEGFPKNMTIMYDKEFFPHFKKFLLSKREEYLSKPQFFHSLLKEIKFLFLPSEYKKIKVFMKENFPLVLSEKVNMLEFKDSDKNSGISEDVKNFLQAFGSGTRDEIKSYLKINGYTKKVKENDGSRSLYKKEGDSFGDQVDHIYQEYCESMSKFQKFNISFKTALDNLKKLKLITEKAAKKFEKNIDKYQRDYDISIKKKEYGNELIEKEFYNRNLKIKKDEKKFILDCFKNLHKILSGFDFQKMGFEEPYFVYFGSFKSGFALKASDIDTTILTNSAFDERELLRPIYEYLEEYKIKNKATFELDSRISDSIRIPIIKFSEKKEKNKEFKADIAINNVLGVSNSSMLKIYSKIDIRCKQMGLILKNWAKKWKITSEDSLSSYSLILMLIYFLQIKKILPSLQKISKESPTQKDKKPSIIIKRTIKNSKKEEFETNISFEDDLEVIKEYMRTHDFPKNEQGLHELFVEFFNFYSDKGAFQKYRLKVNIKSGEICFKNILAKGYEVERLFLFSIKDPFDKNHNPGDRVRKPERINDIKHQISLTILELESEESIKTRYKKFFEGPN